MSHEVEDKAIDLHLFKQSLESRHHSIQEAAFTAFAQGYRASDNAEKVLERLRSVERRGRKQGEDMRYLLLLLLILPFAVAERGHLTLLTVAEIDGDIAEGQGGTADLYLEIQPGSGQIFIDTYPLTRLDTQSSTRYAKPSGVQLCRRGFVSRYDFFYTIRADSSVVGGPSAGGAIAVPYCHHAER